MSAAWRRRPRSTDAPGCGPVTGLNLDKGINFVITSGSCDNIAEITGGTAFQRQFSCRPSSLGELVGQVNDAGGDRLASLRVIIQTPAVLLSLSQGTIELELDPERAPVSVQNFLNYVNSNFYNNTIFHRVIQDFVIQGGGFTPGNPDPVAKPPTQPAIALESNNGLSNVRGTLAMARTSAPDSATQPVLHQRRRQPVARLQERAGAGLRRLRQGNRRARRRRRDQHRADAQRAEPWA